MLDYFYYLTNLTQRSPRDLPYIRKNLYYYVLPYYRQSFMNATVAEQVIDKNLFTFTIVRHPFERWGHSAGKMFIRVSVIWQNVVALKELRVARQVIRKSNFMISIKDLWSSFFSLRLNKPHVRVRGRIVTLKNPTLYNNAITFENDATTVCRL